MQLRIRTLTTLSASLLAAPALAQLGNPTVIFTEITTSSTSVVPGPLDAGRHQVATNWFALEDFAVRRDGGDWIVKGRTTQATTNDGILVRGGAGSPTMFAQDGQPVQGGVAGEQYDFFDSPFPAAWDTAGNLVFGARAKGGVAGNAEKV